jgi:glycosyltransferase involved in cell wall biosynthesis
MKVLFAVPCLSGGGAQFVTSQWARYLALQGDEVTVYTTHPEARDVAPPGVVLVQAPIGRFVAQTRDLARYLRSHPVDVVVTLMPYWNLIGIAAVHTLGTRRPKIVISGRTLAHSLRKVFGGAYARKQWLARRLYRFADLFVAISHPVGAEAIAEYNLEPGQVSVVPNPAIAKLQDRSGARSGVARPTDRLDVVVPARLVPQKRPLIAVDVAAALSSSCEGVTLHFFGVGPLEDDIKARARVLGVDAVMHGWVPNWFDACPSGSVVLLASDVEGFGNVLVEAAAAGFKSVVSSRCMGGADAVVPGLTGEVIAGDSVEEYKAAVLAAAAEEVGDIAPWLRRFSFETSGGILRNELVRLVSPESGSQKAAV